MSTSNERKHRTGDRAVSPVIGVILLVAITVILAAGIGTFVLDIGQSAGDSAPRASRSVNPNPNDDDVTIEHNGGEGLDSSQTRFVIDAGSDASTFNEVSSSLVLSVGSEATVVLSSGSGAGVDWNGDDSLDDPVQGGDHDLTKGERVTIRHIDVESQRVIFEPTVTA